MPAFTKRERQWILREAEGADALYRETGRVELWILVRALRDLTWTPGGTLTDRIRWFASITSSYKPDRPRTPPPA
jgi:hypothetical protein